MPCDENLQLQSLHVRLAAAVAYSVLHGRHLQKASEDGMLNGICGIGLCGCLVKRPDWTCHVGKRI